MAQLTPIKRSYGECAKQTSETVKNLIVREFCALTLDSQFSEVSFPAVSHHTISETWFNIIEIVK